MTVLIFFFRRKLCECFSKGREVENRVVTEPACATLRFKDFAVGSCSNHSQRSILPQDGKRANKMRGAFVAQFSVQFAQKFFHPLRARRLRPRVPGGLHARPSIQARHHKSRIVGKYDLIRTPRIIKRFAQRIFRKRRRRLFERRKGIESRKQIEFKRKRRIVHKRTKFRELSRI